MPLHAQLNSTSRQHPASASIVARERIGGGAWREVNVTFTFPRPCLYVYYLIKRSEMPSFPLPINELGCVPLGNGTGFKTLYLLSPKHLEPYFIVSVRSNESQRVCCLYEGWLLFPLVESATYTKSAPELGKNLIHLLAHAGCDGGPCSKRKSR